MGCFVFFKVLNIFLLSASTHDRDVFSFCPDGRPCNGFQDTLVQYRELLPHLRLAGICNSVAFLFGLISD